MPKTTYKADTTLIEQLQARSGLNRTAFADVCDCDMTTLRKMLKGDKAVARVFISMAEELVKKKWLTKTLPDREDVQDWHYLLAAEEWPRLGLGEKPASSPPSVQATLTPLPLSPFSSPPPSVDPGLVPAEIDEVVLDRWLSAALGCTRLARERAEFENVLHDRLCVGSTVELCHRPSGWQPGRLVLQKGSLDPVRRGFLQHFRDDELNRPLGEKEKENYALIAARPDLSDVPDCQLDVATVRHGLVRYTADNFANCLASKAKPFDLFRNGTTELPNSIVVHLVVLTADDKILIGQRSQNVRFYEKTWAVTCEEHISPAEDGSDPIRTARRGVKEELIGPRQEALLRDQIAVKFYSVFREYDHWVNVHQNQTFWNVNVGIAGVVRLPLASEQVFELWQAAAEDKREFDHLVAIDNTFENLLKLAREDTFDPVCWGDSLSTPKRVNRRFPDLRSELLLRQHPTNKIRLARLLTADYLHPLKQYAVDHPTSG